MHTVIMLVTNWCPHCKNALLWMDELQKENPQYSKIELRIIDEEREPAAANQYDYYYVPTYFVNGVKLHEGVPSKDIVRKVLAKALENNR
ncbi:MAG: glutaredoxin family protein [Peptococcaceae bacterium]